jgi:hypothetical protein
LGHEQYALICSWAGQSNDFLTAFSAVWFFIPAPHLNPSRVSEIPIVVIQSVEVRLSGNAFGAT